jgi:hypothetical protein
MTSKRIIFNLIFLATVFYAPWWLVFLFAIAGTFYFSRYYEVIFFGTIFDFLYGITGSVFFGFGMLGLISASILLIGVERAKVELRS